MTKPDDSLYWVEGMPVDESGRLLHAEDPVAQAARALQRVEQQLTDLGLQLGSVTRLRVRGADLTIAAVAVDVVRERLDELGHPGGLAVAEEDPTLPPIPGMTVAVRADLPEIPIYHRSNSMTAIQDPSPATVLARLDCPVHLPGDPTYDDARRPWNLAVDQRPAAVAEPRTEQDVVEVVRAAGRLGWHIAAQSTGHNAAPLAGRLDDTLLVRLHRLTGVTVDPVAGSARVLGGTLWRDVVAAAAPHGLAAPHGSSPDVAVAGYTLGGGLSWYARAHGFASSHVRSVDIVTADGMRRTVDRHHDPELFWALRGGGGSFGVVVAIEVGLLPVRDVVAGMLLWDGAHAGEVTRVWTDWTRDVSESVTTALRLMSFPPLPELPDFLRGRQVVVVDGALLGSDDEAAAALAPLRALQPEIDTMTRIPAADLPQIHMDPPGPSPAVAEHVLLDELPAAGAAAFVAAAGPGSGSTLLAAELRHLGGRLGRPDPDGGVLDHVDAQYAAFLVAMAPTPEAAVVGRADGIRITEALAPWTARGALLNFSESAHLDPATVFGTERAARLHAVRDVYDPDRRMAANHPVG